MPRKTVLGRARSIGARFQPSPAAPNPLDGRGVVGCGLLTLEYHTTGIPDRCGVEPVIGHDRHTATCHRFGQGVGLPSPGHHVGKRKNAMC